MKAVIQNEFGNADVLRFAEVDSPHIQEGEVLIRTAYTSVNYADIKKRNGAKGKGEFPMILGLDAAGTIEEAGRDSPFSVGDRVMAFPSAGSYAEYVKAKESLVFKIPDKLSFEKAAAMPTVSILSYLLIHEIGEVKKGDTVVVHSAAGGVGSMLVQMSKLAGAESVIATVGDLGKEEYVKELGADAVCTYDTSLFKNAFNFLNLRTPFTKIRSTFPIFQATCRKIFKTVAPTYSKWCKEKNRALILSAPTTKQRSPAPKKRESRDFNISLIKRLQFHSYPHQL